MERVRLSGRGQGGVEVVGKAFPEGEKRGPVDIRACLVVEPLVRAWILEPDPLGTKPACGLLAA